MEARRGEASPTHDTAVQNHTRMYIRLMSFQYNPSRVRPPLTLDSFLLHDLSHGGDDPPLILIRFRRIKPLYLQPPSHQIQWIRHGLSRHACDRTTCEEYYAVVITLILRERLHHVETERFVDGEIDATTWGWKRTTWDTEGSSA